LVCISPVLIHTDADQLEVAGPSCYKPPSLPKQTFGNSAEQIKTHTRPCEGYGPAFNRP
jgi:hypothetical protein